METTVQRRASVEIVQNVFILMAHVYVLLDMKEFTVTHEVSYMHVLCIISNQSFLYLYFNI